VFACIIGFVALGTNQAVFDHSQIEKSASYFVNLAPVIGISLSIPAIYFGFDGFFTATSLYEEVENKSTFSKAMIVGTLIVTAIYLLCSISLIFLNVNGALEETPPLVTKGLSIFLNTCISISIFGVLNGCAYYGTIIFFDAIKNNEVPFAKRFKRQVSANNVKIGMYYSLAVYLIYFLVCSFIGIFYYSNYTNYGATDATGITFGSLLTASDDFSN
jgi:NADH:ubiquinone oxidoreductase subunit 5 (subunit L)/multisubunit Na+/H+ antiporter MnhA subunit